MTNNTLFVENWLNYQKNRKTERAVECVLYSDSLVVGEIEDLCGPYQFINLISFSSYKGLGHILPVIVLRVYYDEISSNEETKKTKGNPLYHGGTFIDEIVSIASLFLGIRLKASEPTREFLNLDNDKMGRPVAYAYTPPPTLSIQAHSPILPCAYLKNINITQELGKTREVLSLASEQQIAIIKAARLYRDALWIAESDPNTAWLFLISAIETVAQAYKMGELPNKELFTQFYPDLCRKLKEKGHEECIPWLAEEFAPITKATHKFISFSCQFLPKEFPNRPAEDFMKIDWSQPFWESTFKTIYDYRSKALHEGIPFPLPMLGPPVPSGSSYSEKGTLGPTVETYSAKWKSADLPINLNLFAQVTREMILNWLHEIIDGKAQNSDCMDMPEKKKATL